jgi:hypothetical protein
MGYLIPRLLPLNRKLLIGRLASHHAAKDLLSRLLAFLFGDAACLNTVNLGLIHFD